MDFNGDHDLNFCDACVYGNLIEITSNWWFIYTMKTKFGVLDKFKVFKTLVENQIGIKSKQSNCDGGGEYNIKNFNTFCKENDIVK
jgi:hypothetical protein